MIDGLNSIEFSRVWETAWNGRDVEAVLKHFHDDAVFTSPIAKRIGFADDGVVKGKDAIRRYWMSGLSQNPDLHFQVTGVYEGINTLVILFRNQQGTDRVEVLKFQHGLVIEGHGMFAAS
jgi:hypothetical protein